MNPFLSNKFFNALCILFIGCSSCLFSQKKAQLDVIIKEKEQPAFERLLKTSSLKSYELSAGHCFFENRDTSSFRQVCRDLLRIFQENAYLSASFDDFSSLDSLHSTVNCHLGPEMRWLALRPAADADEKWLEAAGFREKKFSDKPLHYNAVLSLQKKILSHAENSGFPFAQIWLDSIEINENGSISAVLKMQRNRFFTFGEINNKGDLKLPAGYLPNFLGIKAGTPYSRQKVLRVRERLRALPFMEIENNPAVKFLDEKADIIVSLKKKKASRFDFIIGLLPQSSANDNRLLLTGNLNAAFQNALNLGERLTAEIERLRPETQKIDVQASFPYLLGLPFGLDGHLNIFKRDSTWLDAQGDFGVQYFFESDNYLKVFWENKSSSLLTVDEETLLRNRRLPNNLDLSQNSFGLESVVNRLDFRFNPRKGYTASLKVAAGFSTVKRNSQVEAIRDPQLPDNFFSSLYDSVATKVARYRIEGKTECYIPLFKQSTLKIAARGGALISPERPILTNEQYRLGGNKLLRGFDEESRFATRFVVATLEYRLLIGQFSYLSAFSDYGYLENITKENRDFLRPLGLGAGMNFETKAGIFGISAAIGRQDGQAFDFRAAKFHLGYVSLF